MSTETTVKIQKGERVTIEGPQQDESKGNYPLFNAWGTGRDNYFCIGYGDLKKVWQNMSKTAMWFWWELLETRDYQTNIAKFVAKNPVEQNKVNRAYPEFFKIDFMVRIKKQTYFINPQILLPNLKKYEMLREQYVAQVQLADAKQVIRKGT